MDLSADIFKDFHLSFAAPDIGMGFVFIPVFLERQLITPPAFPKTFSIPLRFSHQNFQQPFLSVWELEIVNTFKNLKRQLQWMAGRFAVKQLALRLIAPGRDARTMEIHHEPMGAPVLPAIFDIPISIAHSGEIAVAAMGLNNTCQVGVDVEKILAIDMDGILRIAFSPREQSALQGRPLSDFYRAWTLKEAFLKLIRKGFHEDMKQVEISGDQIYHEGRLMDHLQIVSRFIGPQHIFSMIYSRDFYRSQSFPHHAAVSIRP